ncbi:MAG TPA: glycosyltransferase family 1 protein [Bryobacteraceae bacterium]|nr:glycosyltransferase family 1 protein [Bryobacteraceae bacterium]
MRLVIDAMPLLVRSAGVKNYLYHWIAHLEQAAAVSQGTPVSIGLFPWLGRPGPLNHEASQVGPLHTWLSLALFHFCNLPGNPALDWFQHWFGHADVFHATRLANPPRRPRLTATLYDLTCWLMPEFHTPANVAAERRLAETVWKRAAGLIAISAHTRDAAVRLLGLDARRIRVIPCGVDGRFFAATAADAARARARYRLERPYVLWVGTIEPRKNLDLALDAWAALPASLGEEFALVVAGPAGWADPRTLRRLRAAPAGVRYLGYVPEADLPGLTSGAAALFYPSLYEGFGLPVAQAMACGVPVVTSGVSALPEVAGEGALYADPRSVSDIRGALERLLLSPTLRRKLAEAGRQRAERYRWEEAARQSLEFFEGLEK